ncbi:hypothetical protein [Microbacterium album]|uniref:Uncharacterized protein n=1 Tax=Microbacterium album TaxID=2053191 RepID=A0A917IFJ8_9MICO|nr:hypothetical protein [Microbacterium album]GGH38642.1 hypothetical protein GCM10010921_09350 [Microbacterium album]
MRGSDGLVNRWMRAAALSGVVLIALTGCTSNYDSVLWRQMDATESAFLGRLSELRQVYAARKDVIARIKSGTYWAGGEPPGFLVEDAAGVVTYNFRPAGAASGGDGSILFDALVYSGPRDPDAPLEVPGRAPGGRYNGPSALYTCFTISVSFTGDRMDSWYRTSDDPELPCPDELVALLDDGAQYERADAFDG